MHLQQNQDLPRDETTITITITTITVLQYYRPKVEGFCDTFPHSVVQVHPLTLITSLTCAPR